MTSSSRSSQTSPSDDYEQALDALRDAVQRGASGASAARRARLDATVAALTEQLARVASRPDEPPEMVVRFTREWSKNERYEYVAIRADDGRWYLSGPQQTGKCYTWDELLDFVGTETPIHAAIDWSLVGDDS